MSQPGQQYVLYQHHSRLEERNHYYVVTTGSYTENFILNLPAGTYKAEWVDPASGSVLHADTFTHKGSARTLTSPLYSVDIALRVKRM